MKPLELSHDIIAKKIWERLPEIDKQLQAVKKSLVQRQRDWGAGNGSYLGEKELAAWQNIIQRIEDSLDEKVLKYIEESRNELYKEVRELEQRAQDFMEGRVSFLMDKELAAWEEPIKRHRNILSEQALSFVQHSRDQAIRIEAAKTAQEQRKEAQRKRTLIFSIITAVGFLFAVALAVWALQQKQVAEVALAALNVEKQKVDSLQTMLGRLQGDIVPRLEELKIAYNQGELTDVSGMLHRVLEMMAEHFPKNVQKPGPDVARDTRSIARWYYEHDNLIIVKDDEYALNNGHLIQPGAIMFYGNPDGKYVNPTIDELTARGGINHVGIVVKVEKDEEGRVIGYSLFHARNPRAPAGTTQHKIKQLIGRQLPPFGNWAMPWVAIAYPLGKPQ